MPELRKIEELAVSQEIEEESFDGLTYKHYKHNFFTHSNERESRLRHLYPYGDPDRVMLDVGAACGTWTLPAALLFNKVYAFEPFPVMAKEIMRNGELNGMGNIGVVQAIVGDSCVDNTVLETATGQWDGQIAKYHLTGPKLSLDSFMSQRPAEKVGYIKIDVEGAELHVLRGAVELLKRDKPNVMVEIHTSYGVDIGKVVDFFTWISCHYNILNLMPQTYTRDLINPCSIFGQYPAGHVHALFGIVEPWNEDFIKEFGGV